MTDDSQMMSPLGSEAPFFVYDCPINEPSFFSISSIWSISVSLRAIQEWFLMTNLSIINAIDSENCNLQDYSRYDL